MGGPFWTPGDNKSHRHTFKNICLQDQLYVASSSKRLKDRPSLGNNLTNLGSAHHMEFEIWQILLLIGMIGFAGFVDSIAGGGGLITIPTYLVLGVPTETILGTNKAVSASGSTIAVGRYAKENLIYWPVIIYGIFAAILGAALGASLSSFLNRDTMILILLVIIPILLYLQQKKGLVSDSDAQHPSKDLATIVKTALISFFIGSYDGIFGPGTGTFLLLAFGLFMKFSAKHASANARIINYASNIGALTFFLSKGLVQWDIAAIAILASVAGNYIGSGMVIKKSGAIVRPVFNLVLVLLMARCVYDLWF